MKIVHIITRMILGGAQENTLLTCEGLHLRCHEVTLITGPALGPEGQLIDRARRGGYRVIELDCLRRAVNPWHDVRCYLRLKQLLTSLDPDIVHTHSAKAGILGRWAAGAVRWNKAAACCTVMERFRRAQAAAGARPRIVHTIHGLAFHPYQAKLLNRFYIAVERTAAKRTDAFISVADAMTRQALAVGIGQVEQFTRIFSGIETDCFLNHPAPARIARLRSELKVPSEAVLITTVARLFHLKGHQYIIESARQIAAACPHAYWVFIGDGLLRDQLKQQIIEAGLQDRFRFTGLMPPESIGELLHTSDILVHCSLREGLARALPQAMLCGKGVISFDVDGAAEVVQNEKTGLLVPPRDIAALSAAQQRLITDPELRHRLGSAGRDLCRNQFDHHLMVDRIEAVYNSL